MVMENKRGSIEAFLAVLLVFVIIVVVGLLVLVAIGSYFYYGESENQEIVEENITSGEVVIETISMGEDRESSESEDSNKYIEDRYIAEQDDRGKVVAIYSDGRKELVEEGLLMESGVVVEINSQSSDTVIKRLG